MRNKVLLIFIICWFFSYNKTFEVNKDELMIDVNRKITKELGRNETVKSIQLISLEAIDEIQELKFSFNYCLFQLTNFNKKQKAIIVEISKAKKFS